MHELQDLVGKTLQYRGEEFAIRSLVAVDGQLKAEVEPPQQTVSDTLARIGQQCVDERRPVQLAEVQRELDLM
jgi:hypothetical protein